MSATYNTSVAFLEGLKLGGVHVVFTNLGSDHPSFLEAIAASKAGVKVQGRDFAFPEFISVPHEFVAFSAAQGYYQATGKVAGVLVHVDCGLQNAGGGIHNLYRAKIPCIVFSGLSPLTQEGELKGSRSEFIHWVQDTPDQPGIVRGYSKYSYEIRTGRNVTQITLRALQLAQTEPKGPVYLFGSREVMEEELPGPVQINLNHWKPVSGSALPTDGVKAISEKLIAAKKPLVVTSWLGRSHEASLELIKLAEALEMPVLDATPFNVNFPTRHRLYAGSQWNSPGQNQLLAEADVVLVLDTDTPWAPTANKPSADALCIHIDQDPLKVGMPLFYIPAEIRYTAATSEALKQINEEIIKLASTAKVNIEERRFVNKERFHQRLQQLEKAALPIPNAQKASPATVAIAALSKTLPKDRFVLSESITNFPAVLNHLEIDDARRYASSGASSLGYHGGAAIGAKYGFQRGFGRVPGTDTFVCAVSGDGSFMFSVPSVVQHLAAKIRTPFLQVILANGGWKAPIMSALSVHPHGHTSRSTGLDLGVMFGPRAGQPDFVALCVAAAGGPDRAWGATVISGSPDMERVFTEAVQVVQGGRQAVVVVTLPDLDPQNP